MLLLFFVTPMYSVEPFFVSGILQRHKPVHIQVFVPEVAIEGFDVLI